jgi:hydroxymethylbilane synthase
VVLARSGLARLGRLDAISQTFSSEEMLPAPGQGALAVECLADSHDDTLLAALAALDDLHSRASATAERTLLARLEAGCAAPIGAIASVAGRTLELRARVTAADGSAALDVRLEVQIVDRAGPVAAARPGGAAATSGVGETTAVDANRDGILAAARLAGRRAADDLLAQGAAALMGARQ